jgi:exodeoxyribonuclease V alpha subunit
MEEIIGYIERITFQSPETGYTVAQLKEPNRADPTCITGTMPALRPGETVRCQGHWKRHLVYGNQFTVENIQLEAPADILGIKKYLGSGLIKGIGATYAKRIVDKFGVETLNIIDQAPERLSEVEGLGKKRLESIRQCWEDQKSIRDVMIFLQSHGVSPSFAQKIYKTYGNKSIKAVQENPYRLAQDIRGIGFRMADKIAETLGIAKTSPERIDAGIEFVLSACSEEGHACFPLFEFLVTAEDMLQVPQQLIGQRVEALAQEKRIFIDEMVSDGKMTAFIWQRPLFLCEQGIGRQVERLRHAPCLLRNIDLPKALEWVQTHLGIKLAENQLKAVAQALIDKILIITGGPGTGKSTITKAILSITEKLTANIVLAAPTGRAAKRMTEITGKKAKTIHSLLEYDFKTGKFKRGIESPLECDLIVIDEASMIDTPLMYSLLKAIPSYSRVIFVGDINQLPSVGPGNVLKDMISSRSIPLTSLNEIFRQAAGSRIVTNAHSINQGRFPDIRNSSDSDFFFMDIESPEEVLNSIVRLVSQRLPRKYGLDPIHDIQVLAPMKRGMIGIENLNIVLQQELNPNGQPLFWGGKRLLPGDKVMQIRNDHKREVYNGDVGIILNIDPSEQAVTINFEGREVHYSFSDLDEVVLA